MFKFKANFYLIRMAKKISRDLQNITKPDSIKYPQLCVQCGKSLPKRHVMHKNIAQDPQVHKFCSKDCKGVWCANIQIEAAKK